MPYTLFSISSIGLAKVGFSLETRGHPGFMSFIGHRVYSINVMLTNLIVRRNE